MFPVKFFEQGSSGKLTTRKNPFLTEYEREELYFTRK